MSAGATQVTLEVASELEVAATEVTTPGLVTGRIGSLCADAELVPARFVAVIEKEYDTPEDKPVARHEVVVICTQVTAPRLREPLKPETV